MKLDFYKQRTIEWDHKKGSVKLIDQSLLPNQLRFIGCGKVSDLVLAIKTMKIRGAPAIGVAGAMGVALAVLARPNISSKEELLGKIGNDVLSLKEARPTAVNLAWGVDRAVSFVEREFPSKLGDELPRQRLVEFVKDLADKDVEANKRMSSAGAPLIRNGASVLTHCN